MNRIDILGTEFDNISIVDAVEYAWGTLSARKAALFVTPNSEMVLDARKNRLLRSAIRAAELVLPDGIGVIYASRILGTPIMAKVAGIDFASALLARMGEQGKSAYLLGAKPGVADKAAETLCRKYPGLVIAGASDGYFVDDTAIIEKINASDPDFLMVCLGSPKQEQWMIKNRDRLKVGAMAGLGGVLDVYAGTVERAPQKWIDMGLEWLYRLIKEPRRITRMLKLPGIIVGAILERLGI